MSSILDTRIPTFCNSGVYKEEVVDNYGKKVLTSGYEREQVMKIEINGIKGYLNKRNRRRANGSLRIHRTAKESKYGRMKKKLIGKSSWYKRKSEAKNTGEQPHGSKVSITRPPPREDLKTRDVLFLEQTPNRELARQVKELLQRLEPVLGFRLSVVERTGRSLQNLHFQATIWKRSHCDREHCVTCQQGDEDMPDCTKSSMVYESVCSLCNPGRLGKVGLVEQQGVLLASM